MVNREELSTEHIIPFPQGLQVFNPRAMTVKDFRIRLLDWQGAGAAIYGTDPVDGRIYNLGVNLGGNDIGYAADAVVERMASRVSYIRKLPIDKRSKPDQDYLAKASQLIDVARTDN